MQNFLEKCGSYTNCLYLLSRGIMLKVIEPQWLADEIYEMHLQAAEMYEER